MSALAQTAFAAGRLKMLSVIGKLKVHKDTDLLNRNDLFKWIIYDQTGRMVDWHHAKKENVMNELWICAAFGDFCKQNWSEGTYRIELKWQETVSKAVWAYYRIFYGILKIKSGSQLPVSHFCAEREGFEPPEPFSSTVFKTAVIDHSTTSPIFHKAGKPPYRVLFPKRTAKIIKNLVSANYFCFSRLLSFLSPSFSGFLSSTRKNLYWNAIR